MRKERYHPEADNEVTEAGLFIEERRPEFGAKFLKEIDTAISHLVQEPYLWPVRMRGFRKYTTTIFKYQIWYRIADDEIYIIAVHHSSRRPGYWKERILDEQR